MWGTAAIDGANFPIVKIPATETDLTPDGVLEYGVMEYEIVKMEYDSQAPYCSVLMCLQAPSALAP